MTIVLEAPQSYFIHKHKKRESWLEYVTWNHLNSYNKLEFVSSSSQLPEYSQG